MPKQKHIRVTISFQLSAVDSAILADLTNDEARQHVTSTLLAILARHRAEPLLGKAHVEAVEIQR